MSAPATASNHPHGILSRGWRGSLHPTLLTLALAALLAGNVVWLVVDRHPTDMDQGRYMMMVREFADGWSAPDADTIASLWTGNHPTHPHLLPLVASIPFALFERSPDAAYLVNTLFYLGVVAVVFSFGVRLGGPDAGLLAAFLAAGFPLLARFSRFFLLEEATAFFVVATLYSLHRTEHFSNLRWSGLAGSAVALGLLTKWTTIVFVLPPILTLAAVSLTVRRSPRAVLGLALLGIACATIAAPWYLTHLEEVRSFFVRAETSLLFAGDDGPGLRQLLFYLRMFWATSGWPFTLLALAGLVHLVGRPTSAHAMILSSMLVPLAVFAFFISTQDIRHLLPAVPGVLLAAALAVRSLPAARIRRALTAGGFLLALLSAVHSAGGLPGIRSPLTLGSPSSLVLPAARPPDRRDWRLVELLESAERDFLATADSASSAPVRVLAGNLPFRTNGFVFLAAERFPSLRLVHVPFFLPPGGPAHRHLGVEALLEAGYLIGREGDVNANANGMFDYSRALLKLLDDRIGRSESRFEVVYTTTLAGGHVARVVRADRADCDIELLQFLDWAHELDPDDPGLLRAVERCAGHSDGERDEIWGRLAATLRLSPLDRRREPALATLAADHPELRWPRRMHAESLRSAGHHDSAARAYAGIGTGAPYLCSPFLWAGDSWQRAGSLNDAERAYQQAVADSPDCVRAHSELAKVLHRLGDETAARREERKATLLIHQARASQNLDTARFRLLLGDLSAGAGEESQARHHYEAGVRNDPTDEEIRARLLALGPPLSGPGPGAAGAVGRGLE